MTIKTDNLRNEYEQQLREMNSELLIFSVRQHELVDQVRLAEAHRRLALDAAELGSWHLDIASMGFEIDERFRTISGIPTGQPYEEASACIHPDDQARVDEAVAAAIRADDPAPYDVQYRVVHPDDSVHWIHAKGRPNVQTAEPHEQPLTLDGTIADITERKLGEEALRRSEEKYRTLFESIDEGVTTLEVVFDENGRAVDWVYVENNPAFAKLSGLSDDVIGRRVSDVLPNLEPFWLETYGRVAATGEPERVEHAVAELDSWYDVHASRVGGTDSRTIVTVYTNITTRKRHEAHLSFLAEVSKDLVALTNIGDTMDALGAKIGAYFGVARIGFFEFNEAADEAVCEYAWHAKADDISLVGNFRTADFYTDADEFISTLRAGEAFVLGDRTADGRVLPESLTALDIRSFIVVPAGLDTRLPLSVLAVNDNKPRHWREDEINLMRELTTRIWTRLERARTEEALAASEAKYRTLFNSTDQGFAIVEVIQDAHGTVIDCLYLEVNRAYDRQIGFSDVEGKLISKVFPQQESYWMEQFDRVIQTGEPIRFENYSVDTGKWYQANYTRVGGADSRLVSIVFDEITERKRREANLAFLAEVSADLVRLTNINETTRLLAAKIASHFNVQHVYFSDIDEDARTLRVILEWHPDGAPSYFAEATHGLDKFVTEEFLQAARAGEVIAINDTGSDAKTNADSHANVDIGSFVTANFVRDEKWHFAITIADSNPREWREEEIQLMRELTTRIWTSLERTRAEDNLAASEVKYRTLFQSIDEGFCVLEVLFDESGEAYNYVFHEANAAFERHSGLVGPVGRSILDLVPEMEPQWAKVYAQVAKTGEPVRFDANVESMDRVFDIYAFSDGTLGENKVAVVFNDITERKRREANLAFLADLAIDFAIRSSAEDVMQTIGAKVGAYLNASSCLFAEIDESAEVMHVETPWHAGVRPVAGDYKLGEFVTEAFCVAARSDKTIAVSDTQADERTNAAAYAAYDIGSFISAPFVREGKWKFLFTVNSNKKREWREDEIDLVCEVTHRLSPRLERARAEAEVKALNDYNRNVLESITDPFFTLDRNWCFTYMSRGGEELVLRKPGELLGKSLWDEFSTLIGSPFEGVYRSAMDENITGTILDYFPDHKRWYELTVYPSNDGVTVYFRNLTTRKRAELNTTFLAEISQDLLHLTNVSEMMQTVGAKIGKYFGGTICAFSEIDAAADKVSVVYEWCSDDAQSLIGEYKMSEFITDEHLRDSSTGLPVVVRDASSSPYAVPENLAAVNVRSFVNIPLLRGGAWLFQLGVYDSAVHAWLDDEVDLMGDLATRIWTRLERLRTEEALREAHSELRRHSEEIEGFNRLMVGRELRMIALKQEINALSAAHGQPRVYAMDVEGNIEEKLTQ